MSVFDPKYLTDALNRFYKTTIDRLVAKLTGVSPIVLTGDFASGLSISYQNGAMSASGALTLATRGQRYYHNFGNVTVTVPTAAAAGTSWTIDNTDGCQVTIVDESGGSYITWNATTSTSAILATGRYRSILVVKTSATSVVVFATTTIAMRQETTAQENVTVDATVAGRNLAGALTVAAASRYGQPILGAIRYLTSDNSIANWDARSELESTVSVPGEVQQSAAVNYSTYTYKITLGQ